MASVSRSAEANWLATSNNSRFLFLNQESQYIIIFLSVHLLLSLSK
jgi:hypothetical protein